MVTVETPHLHTAMLSVYVRVGSRHEERSNNGVSHFLEHMFFRGSERHPDTVQMNATVEACGGNLNGITTRDHSYYYTPIHPEHLDVAFDVLGDMLTRPLLAKMDIERQVILEEMLDEVDERGRDIDLDNLSKMELFGAHPLSLKIAGTCDSVKALSMRQLKSHLKRFYVRPNVVVSCAGRVDRREVLDLAARAFGELRSGEPTQEEAPPPSPKGPHFKLVEHGEAQTELRFSFRTVPEPHEDFAALQLVRRVLDDGLSSRLPFNVVERRGLAYSVHAAIEAYCDVGLFEVEAASAPKKAAEVAEEICRTLAELCEDGVTDEELERAKRRHRIFLEFAQDSPGELCGWFGGTELFRLPEDFEERCRKVEAQTKEKVLEVAKATFRKENLVAVAVGQRSGARALERAVARADGLR